MDLKIGSRIIELRKKKEMTQEQLADALGVSAPAVSKWETGASYPDITLLAPLARALHTDIDTLLAFRGELTDKEIDRYTAEVSEVFLKKEFVGGYERCGELIREFPGCDKLTLSLAEVSVAYLAMEKEEVQKQCRPQIIGWLKQVAMSREAPPEVIATATAMLCLQYMNQEAYEEAQELLNSIPPLGYDKRPIQYRIYMNQGKKEEAATLLDTMLYQAMAQAQFALQIMYSEAGAEEKQEDAGKSETAEGPKDAPSYYLNLLQILAEQFELGDTALWAAQFTSAAERGDKEQSLTYLEKFAESIGSPSKIGKGRLYRHMPIGGDASANLRHMLAKSLEESADYDFIRDDPRFLQLKERLKG